MRFPELFESAWLPWLDGEIANRAEGLAVLDEKARSGRPPVIDGETRAKITALACTTPPQGHGQWSLRLLADKVVELGYCESISHTYINELLKKNELKPHLRKNVVHRAD